MKIYLTANGMSIDLPATPDEAKRITDRYGRAQPHDVLVIQVHGPDRSFHMQKSQIVAIEVPQ